MDLVCNTSYMYYTKHMPESHQYFTGTSKLQLVRKAAIGHYQNPGLPPPLHPAITLL